MSQSSVATIEIRIARLCNEEIEREEGKVVGE